MATQCRYELEVGEGHLSGLRGQMSGKRTFERQKCGRLSEMKSNPFQGITCIPVS